jgi:hypothetical protein
MQHIRKFVAAYKRALRWKPGTQEEADKLWLDSQW